MLDIVITHYQEPWAVCKGQFEMLDAQRGVDWKQIRVTVVNDGGHRLPDDRLADLSYQVEQLDIPHGGVSRARNAGLDHATEPWVMFCDCDDRLAGIFALADILNVLGPEAEAAYDLMWTRCWEECNGKDGRPVIFEIPKQKAFVFIHGKVYRRQFLLDQGIRFDEGQEFNEDSLFNAVILTRITNTRVGEIRTTEPAYCWIRRDDSVTLSPGARERSAMGQLTRNMKVAEETRQHRPQAYDGMVTRTVYDAYFMEQTRRISAEGKDALRAAFSPWAADRLCVFSTADVKAETLDKIRAVSREELTDQDEQIPDDWETVRAWMEKTAWAYLERVVG